MLLQKCDLRKPCQSCAGSNTDCEEYTPYLRQHRVERQYTDALEEKLTILESRVRELEERGRDTSPSFPTPIPVRSDYTRTLNTRRSSSSLTGYRSGGSPSSSTTPPFSATPPQSYRTASGSPADVPSLVGFPYTGVSSTPGLEFFVSDPQSTIDIFIKNAPQLGFFLHPGRFREAALLPLAPDHPAKPTVGLLATVYLWGVHLSDSRRRLADDMLAVATKCVAADLATMSPLPRILLPLIQAHILLAYYFFQNGQFMEAKCYCGLAVNIALGAGLHQICSNSKWSSLPMATMAPTVLVAPRDDLEQGQIINAFWTVLVLHKLLAVALDPPSNVCGALEVTTLRIQTPWPFDLNVYSGNLQPYSLTSNRSVIEGFLQGGSQEYEEGNSALGLHAKGAILYHKAAQISGQLLDHHASMPETSRLAPEIALLEANITNIRSKVPDLSHFDPVVHVETANFGMATHHRCRSP
ncbi:hypothetical protein HGRIS_004584 [Hohenbuehelia grisea]|uniref:Zn(2)-C6 fungal-type domain-containing protein n=1 Tax=Hohenbuehelia grisea TaxID=104357 RepID=A0ABR3JCX5_9AGAR